jgi:DNA-binding response OmpR family regulator
MPAQENSTVLVADDDPTMRFLCRVNLEHDGYRVLEAANGAEIDATLAVEPVAALLLDVRFGAEDGIEIARRLREQWPGLRIGLLTGHTDDATGWTEVADAFLAKPFSLEALAATVRELLPAE